MKKLAAAFLALINPYLIAATPSSLLIGELELEYCHISGFSQEVLCGDYAVYEDRTAQGKQITIRFAVVPAVTIDKQADPLVFFAGGPGQASLEVGAFVNLAFDHIRENRDIVLIDQRGMGSSNPLDCEMDDDISLLLMSDEERARAARENLQQCLTELDADVTRYTQDIANEDIHEILIALGYDRVNLYGGSWGTRSALLYNRQFPEHVRTMILDGTAPPENKVPLYANADAERSLQALFRDCGNDGNCQAAFPALEQDFSQVLDALGSEGREVTLNDATTGEATTFLLTRSTFANGIRAILYSPQISRLIPIIIQQAKANDFRAFNGIMDAMGGDVGIAIGAQMTILCAEDFSRMTPEEIAAESSTGFVGDAFMDIFRNSCDVWPRAPLPDIYSQDLSSQVPALILSGAIDPVTPERWGERTAELLSNSVHLIAPNTGHNVAPFGCAPELMAQFVDEARVDNIDGSCLDELSRPSFFVDGSGPTPAPDDGEASDEPGND